ncbi:MAG: hypothetical protein LBT40_11020 [Deltaproteobacteria bacterium]|nr:hypothetical protein [Deltaproteobacteria bacterium]
MARYRDPGPDPSVDNRLKVINDGRQEALWDGLIDPAPPDFAGSRISLAVAERVDPRLIRCGTGTRVCAGPTVPRTGTPAPPGCPGGPSRRRDMPQRP